MRKMQQGISRPATLSTIITLSTLLLLSTAGGGQALPQQISAMARAKTVTITRDDWGIAHIHGHTDADAVFGMIYAQCEDDFHRVERNYLTSLGRTAEADGESALWVDLRQRLFIDPEELKKDYIASPEWLRKLMDAWADGINYYLARHPEVKPQVLTHFSPWMALSFTEGSIGGDIERVDLEKLQDFYGKQTDTRLKSEKLSASVVPDWVLPDRVLPDRVVPDWVEPEPKGSNGIAIAPANTRDHHALLLINPHTSFFFRSELQMASDEGMNAYGAVTWGQFFVYQGFNDRAGWMHTSSGVDAVDEFAETVQPASSATGKPERALWQYKYGSEMRPVEDRAITIAYKSGDVSAKRTFLARYTAHGPIIRADAGKWIAIKLMNIPVPALEQSYLRTKSRTYAEYVKTMELQANSSNNTIFADADGDIAYWHGNFIPRRDVRFDYTKPVDGSNPATDWHGLHPLAETPQLHNPASGYLFNVNDSPWNGAGVSSLKQKDFPAYVEQGVESARGVHAMRVLEGKTDFTLDSFQAAAYDSYMPWFARTIPALLTAYKALPRDSSTRAGLKAEIDRLADWDFRWSAESNATSLAVYWGTELMKTAGPGAREAAVPSEDYVATSIAPKDLLIALSGARTRLMNDFGKTEVAWGEINRFQRLTGDIVQPFNDSAPSVPVPFASALWGSLASFGARQYPITKKWYGTSGNSFVAVVEFGPRVHARAVTAGGESGDPHSRHFNDEAQRYAGGRLRDVYFYPDELKPHTERVYHPGN